jgi:hypothetical protein
MKLKTSKIYCFSNKKVVRTYSHSKFRTYQGGQEFKGTKDLQPHVMSQDKSGQADRRQTCVLMNQATHVPALLITY